MVKGKGEAASEAQKWNPGSETDLMVVVVSLAKVRCGGGAQNSVGGIVASMSRGCFREKGREHCVERCEAKPMAWMMLSGNQRQHRK